MRGRECSAPGTSRGSRASGAAEVWRRSHLSPWRCPKESKSSCRTSRSWMTSSTRRGRRIHCCFARFGGATAAARCSGLTQSRRSGRSDRCVLRGARLFQRCGDRRGVLRRRCVISATNADVLARHDVDLAIVISPMTGASGRPSLARSIRRFCRRTLDHEIRALERKGIPTVVIEPGEDVLR